MPNPRSSFGPNVRLGGGGPVGPALAGALGFLSNLSNRGNIDTQAQFMAKDLTSRGVPEQVAWDLAHQYAIQNNIHKVNQTAAAEKALMFQLALNRRH